MECFGAPFCSPFWPWPSAQPVNWPWVPGGCGPGPGGPWWGGGPPFPPGPPVSPLPDGLVPSPDRMVNVVAGPAPSQLPQKGSADTLDYTINCMACLMPGDYIASATVTIGAPQSTTTPLTLVWQRTVGPGAVVLMLSSGSPLTLNKIAVSVTTAQGRIFYVACLLFVDASTPATPPATDTPVLPSGAYLNGLVYMTDQTDLAWPLWSNNGVLMTRAAGLVPDGTEDNGLVVMAPANYAPALPSDAVVQGGVYRTQTPTASLTEPLFNNGSILMTRISGVTPAGTTDNGLVVMSTAIVTPTLPADSVAPGSVYRTRATSLASPLLSNGGIVMTSESSAVPTGTRENGNVIVKGSI